jgi:hypothetical protein
MTNPTPATDKRLELYAEVVILAGQLVDLDGDTDMDADIVDGCVDLTPGQAAEYIANARQRLAAKLS